MSPPSTPVRLFYSYAQQDAAHQDKLATHLTLLRRQGLLDDFHSRCVLPGAPWKDVIDQKLSAAEVILLLISPDFVASDYCYESEMRRALQHGEAGQCVVVPVLVRPTDLSLTPFSRLQCLPRNGQPVTTWNNEDEAWLGVTAGVRALVEARRTPVTTGAAEAPLVAARERAPVPAPLLLSHDYRPLFCDRYTQWKVLLDLLEQRRHELVLLPGARGQGHEYFLVRVRTGLPADATRRVISVAFRTRPFPRIKNDFLDDLATALACPREALRSELARLLDHRDLILLHPCVRDGFADADALLRYHTEWLPELLEGLTTDRCCKVIQPIEWRRAGLAQRLAARLVGALWPGQPGWLRRARQEEQAVTLMDRLARQAHARLPVYRMTPLRNITRAHVHDFCRLIGLPPADHTRFVDTVMDGARTSHEIIQAIADHLPPQAVKDSR